MSRSGALIAALLVAAVPGGAAGFKDAFPIGVFNVDDPALLKPLRDAGIDSFLADPKGQAPEGYEALARRGRALGMTMLADPRPLLAGKVSPKKWPLLAWYLVDEPEVNRVSTAALSELAAKVARLDPRPGTFAIGTADAAPRFAAIGDGLMLDWYPVPNHPVVSVAEQIDRTLAALPSDKRLWFIVQAFDWRDALAPGQPSSGRFPTEIEVRLMSYLAVMHGAHGLFYFRLERPEGKTLLDEPSLWARVARTTHEMAFMKPIFAGGSVESLPFVPDPESGTEARCWRYHGRRYLVLANASDKRDAAVPSVVLTEAWRPLFEPRRDPREALLREGESWYLHPYQVLVLEGR